MAEGARTSGMFARIESSRDAFRIVREASYAFLFVAALQALAGILMSPSLMVDAVILALLAGVLMKWRSRTAAVLLLLVSALQAFMTVLNRLGTTSIGGRNALLAAVMLVLAVRAVEATFKLHGRFRQGLTHAG